MPVTAVSSPSRRARILTAALEAFNEGGVAGTSIDDIRRRSGASIGSIYHHFEGKDGIAGALYLEGLGDYQDGFLAVLNHSMSTRDGVEGAVHHHLAWIAGNQQLARFLLLGRDATVVAVSGRPLRELNRRFFRAVRRWIRPRVERGELLELAPEVVTALWIGPSQEFARHWLAGRTRVDLQEQAPVLAKAAWRSLGTEEA